MKEIKLTLGLVTLVDDEDYEWLNQWSWSAHKHDYGFYARRNGVIGNGVRKTVRMHRFILGLTDPKLVCDHIDHNGLNNQRYNLRIATPSENCCNSRKRINSSSKYIGVSWSKKDKIWKVQINKNNKHIYLGIYKCEIEAALAYNKAAIDLHGEFANINQIAI